MKRILTIALLALALAIPAQATTYYVSPAGTVGGAGTTWGTALDSPTTAVAKASSGDTIVISNGTYSIRTVMAASTKVLTMQGYSDSSVTNVIINGATGSFASGFTTTTNVSMYRINMAACSNSSYGAAYMSGGNSHYFEGCAFFNNWNPAASGSGAGIYESSPGASLTITNCSFTGNYSRNAAALYISACSTGIVCYSTFLANSGTVVGAACETAVPSQSQVPYFLVYSNYFGGNWGGHPCWTDRSTKPGMTIISNCVFVANTNQLPPSSAGSGGIVDIYTASYTDLLTVIGCTFVSNSAQASCPGVYLGLGSSTCNVFSCSFISNLVFGSSATYAPLYVDQGIISGCSFVGNINANPGNGGGAAMNDAGATNTLFYNCGFTNNLSPAGGAMSLRDGIVSNCSFTGNMATNGYGSAVFRFAGASPVIFSGCSFLSNTFVGVTKYGTVYMPAAATGIFNNCSFIGNSNAQGTCAGIYGNCLSITNCTFTGNWSSNSPSALSILVSSTYTSSVVSCSIASNVSGTGNGGTLSIANVGTIVSNCSFVGNQGKGTSTGGTIYWTAAGGVCFGCGFTNNLSPAGGGGVAYIDQGAGTFFSACSFMSNSAASGSGGALYAKEGVFSNCVFSGNSALNGGAIYNVAAAGTRTSAVFNCVFSNNTASQADGALFISGAFPWIVQNCTFIGNSSASGHGSVIEIQSSSNVIRGCLFAGNSGFGNAGVYIYSGTKNVLDNCTIVQNYNASGGPWGAGVSLYGVGMQYLTNCIVWSNWSGTSPIRSNDNVGIFVAGATGTFVNCCINTSAPSAKVGYPTNWIWTSSITNDPLFVNVGSLYGTNLLTAPYDFRPSSASPCLATGTNEPWMSTAFDLAGNPWAASLPNRGCYNNQFPASPTSSSAYYNAILGIW